MVAAAAFAFGLTATAGSAAPPPSAQQDQPSLAEAARRNRARVAASREQHGPAPRFTDADLAGGYRRGITEPPRPANDEEPPVAEAEARDVEPGDDTVDIAPAESRAAMDARLLEIGERVPEILERLLDIEASLTAIGASGLPFAQRNPNRLRSPLDASRLRAEQEELRRELDALVAERRLLR